MNNHQYTGKLRPNIGLLGSPMHSEQGFWAGVADAAEKYAVNLFVYLGGAVMTEQLKPTIRYGLIGIESGAVLYDLVDVDRMDGMITWAGKGAGLGIHLNDEEMNAFFRRYHPLPIVNYEKIVDGIPSVLTDTAEGMRELLIHMIEEHGSRRIALIRGPQNHFESNERHRAYNETLAEYGLTIDPNLVCTVTGWDTFHGAEMTRLLLNERGMQAGIDFDTIVGTEGQFIVSAVQELQSQGIRVPDDVIVAGYNDIKEARAIAPSITIMRKSFYDAGWKSLEIMLDILAGKAVPAQTFVPSDLIIRRSCGCWPQSVQQVSDQILPSSQQSNSARSQSFEGLLAEGQSEIVATLARSMSAFTSSELANEVASTLVNALFADVIHKSASNHIFLAAFEDALQAKPAKAQNPEQWHPIISTLRRYMIDYLGDDLERRFQLENLWQQTRVLIQLEAQRLELEHNLEDLLLALSLRETDRRLMDVFDMAELMDTIAQELPRLGIPSCYISLYEKPQPYTYPQVISEWSRLVLAFDERGRIELPPKGQRFQSRNLIPDDLPLPDRTRSQVIVPLYVKQQQFGFALLEAGPKKGTLYTELWQLISNALQIVILMKERLELAVERERVSILSNFIQDAGHEFRTPLSTINTSLYMLNHPLSPETHARHLRTLKNQSAHIQTLIEGMLRMSRLDSSHEFAFVQFNVADLLRELETNMSSQAHEKQINFIVELTDNLPYIHGDKKELFDALSYIIENAIQYTPIAGKNTIKAYANKDSVIIEIADTGIGINENEFSRIFERFYRVDPARTDRGAGLGLSIAKKIIDLHRGNIEVASLADQGSIFKIILPIINRAFVEGSVDSSII